MYDILSDNNKPTIIIEWGIYLFAIIKTNNIRIKTSLVQL